MENTTDKSIQDFLVKMGNKSDSRFDPFLEFLREKRLTVKLSFHDVKQIFNYFKENWKGVSNG